MHNREEAGRNSRAKCRNRRLMLSRALLAICAHGENIPNYCLHPLLLIYFYYRTSDDTRKRAALELRDLVIVTQRGA